MPLNSKFPRVLYHALDRHGVRAQADGHEVFGRRFKGGPDAELPGRHISKARVVPFASQNHGVGVSQRSGDPMAFPDQGGAHPLPLVGGKFAYMSSAVMNFFRGVCDDMSAEFDGRKVGGPLTLVCACNGRYYGGGFNPVPDARPDDGEIDFLVVRGMSRLDFLRFARRYSVGRAHELPGETCIRHRGRELTVEAREPVCVSVDGEELRSRSIVFRAVPGGVNFIFPRGMEFFKDSNMKTGEK